MKSYVGSYTHGGREYSITIPAKDWADAERRLKSIGRTGEIDGQEVVDIPVNAVTLAPVGVVGRMWCWVRNWRG